MAYSTGTVVGASSTVGTADEFYTSKIRPLLLTHAAWTFIEDFTDSSSIKHSVWKVAGASNVSGNDFYISFARNPVVNSSQLFVLTFEQYSAATHTYVHAAINNGSSAVATIANGTYSDTAFPLHYSNNLINTNATVSVSGTGGTYDYWIVATNNGITICTRIAATVYAIHVGMYDTFLSAANDPYPLAAWSLNNTGSNPTQQSATRMPMMGAHTALQELFQLLPPGVPSWTWWTLPPTNYSSTAFPDLYYGAPLASRIMVANYYPQLVGLSATSSPVTGFLRGLMRDIVGLSVGSGGTTGDTITIGGQTYVLTSNSLWVNTQAA